MLITKEVEVMIGSNNIKYYENLGYIIPRSKDKWGEYTVPRGTKIIIKIEDLLKSTKVYIKCYCDDCYSKGIKTELDCTYIYYYNQTSNNKPVLCKRCLSNKKSLNIKKSEYHKKRTLSAKINNNIKKINKEKEKIHNRVEYLENIRTTALNIGLNPLFENSEYINNKTLLRFICPKHGIILKSAQCILKEYKCKYCASEKVSNSQRYSYDFVKNKYLENGFILLEDNYINVNFPMKCYCIKHTDKIQYKCFKMILENRMCFYCQHEIQQKEGHPSWKGGVTLLYNYLRTVVDTWKYESSDFYNNRCVLTNNYNTVIHHIYKNFSEIVHEVLDKYLLNYDNISINNIPSELLKNIEMEVLKLHYNYGYGIPLHKNIHKLYHKIYGRRDNNFNQFEEFKIRLKSGEFDSFLEENNLKLVI